MKKCQKQSGTDEFWPKNEYCQISSSFGQHACSELNRVPGVLLEPYMSQGGQGSAELPIVLKGLSYQVIIRVLPNCFSMLSIVTK